MKHLGALPIETERLLIRPYRAGDEVYMYKNWGTDSKVNTFLSWPMHTDIGVSKSVVDMWIEENKQPCNYNWGIELKENGELIGAVNVVWRDDATESVELGYCIGSPWWGKGIMSEAVSAIIAFFFEQVELNRVQAKHDPENIGSGRVMDKCGMAAEGRLRQCFISNRGRTDVILHAIRSEDYRKSEE